MTRLTDEQIAELKRLEKAATPGEWHAICAPLAGSWHVGQIHDHRAEPLRSKADADLAVRARNALPALLSEVSRRRAEDGRAGLVTCDLWRHGSIDDLPHARSLNCMNPRPFLASPRSPSREDALTPETKPATRAPLCPGCVHEGPHAHDPSSGCPGPRWCGSCGPLAPPERERDAGVLPCSVCGKPTNVVRVAGEERVVHMGCVLTRKPDAE